MPEFILDRRFNAPRDLVWRAWTEPELLARWYGPGVETIIHKLDVRPGDLWLNEMKLCGGSHYQRVEYTEVDVPEKLVWIHSVSDGEWGIASNPIMPDWPRVPINGSENSANKSAPSRLKAGTAPNSSVCSAAQGADQFLAT